jgi:ATP-binding cassette subfamily B multidrug efflux pump
VNSVAPAPPRVVPSPVAPPAPAEAVTNGQLLTWMFGFLRPVKPLVAVAVLWLVAVVSVDLWSTRVVSLIVNYIQRLAAVPGAGPAGGFWAWMTGPSAAPLRQLAVALAVLVSLMAVFRYLREVANTKMSMTMVYYIREGVYDKLQRVGFSFHDTLSTGQLINRALTDLQNVRQFVQTAVLTSLEIALYVAGYIYMIGHDINPWLALASLVPLPLWTWYILRFGKRVQPASKAVMEAGDKTMSVLTENIAGVHVVKAFATEPQEIAKFGASCDTFFERTLRRIQLFADFTPIIRAIGGGSHLSLFLLGGVAVLAGRMEAGGFIILSTAMGTILGKLQQVGTINEQYQNAIVSARRLHEVLTAPPGVPERPDARALPAGPGAVRFEHVTFGYDPAKPVLHDVSFEVAGGSVVAVVGPTGAGKSTLCNLLSRFYDAQQGRITIDGVDTRDVRLSSLRTQVGYVFQETYLFSDTVEANIAYGRPHITGGEVEAAARLAQAHEFIEALPLGYQSMLGERGSSLSGGQKQRLAIARAILTNPRILVLDDATAAIDAETEDLIRRGMKFVMHGRTTFVIAHRVSTVKRADLVLVLERGRIAQMGTHRQLMAEGGHYRDVAAAQLAVDDDGTVAADAPSHMDRVRDHGAVTAAG